MLGAPNAHMRVIGCGEGGFEVKFYGVVCRVYWEDWWCRIFVKYLFS